MDPLPKGVVGGRPLGLQVIGCLMDGLVDGLTESGRVLHLYLCSRRVVGGEGLPLVWGYYTVCVCECVCELWYLHHIL